MNKEEPNLWMFLLGLVLVALSVSLFSSGSVHLNIKGAEQNKTVPAQGEQERVAEEEPLYRLI